MTKNLGKKQEKAVQQEVKKTLAEIIIGKTKSSTARFKKEFKKQIITGVTAAFAFLIALSWRAPVQNSIDNLIRRWGLVGGAVYFEYVSAIFITLIAVLILIMLSKWASKGA